MTIKIYNSLSRKKEDFTTVSGGKDVLMYVCGPTVYALSHIGHARSAVAFDVIYKYLKHRGYNVKYARNYTDVDDKIINRANEEGVDSGELAERFILAFDEDMDGLGVALPDVRPKATETIEKIIELTQSLIAKKSAYQSGGDVFYSVRLKSDYGKLSGKNIDELESGARVDVNEGKLDPLDFALWKAAKPGEPAWESPWGPGRPGWHIECSAMCMHHLGRRIDIHGGGRDLIFPHHENEIAQSESASGEAPFAKYWLHNGFVNIEKEKMSKSVGNILNIRDVLKDHTGEAVRLFLLGSHYRSPIDYSKDSLKEAEAGLERFYKTVQRAGKECPGALISRDTDSSSLLKPILDAMDDDFNTAEAIGLVFKEVNLMNKSMDNAGNAEPQDELVEFLAKRLKAFKEISEFLGIFGSRPEEYFKDVKSRSLMPAGDVERLIEERNEARRNKDFKKADSIRAGLLEKGIALEDTPTGTTWGVKKD